MKEKIITYLKKNALLFSLLAVSIAILVFLILNLRQGGLWVISGMNGKSSYEIAVENGFTGSREEWIAALQGKDGVDGTNGKSAYELAVENGFEGTLEEWLLSLQFGEDGKDGKDGIDGQNGKNGKDGQDGAAGADGVSIVSVYINEQGHLTVVLSNGETIDAGDVANLAEAPTLTDYHRAVIGGFVGTRHEWLCSYNDGSRSGVSVKDIQINDDNELILTLNDDTTLNAGEIEADGRISTATDEMGFSEHFEKVILHHESGALKLRDEPNVETGGVVVSLPNGTELVCIGAGIVETSEDVFYRFCYNGRICYAKAKFFEPKHEPN